MSKITSKLQLTLPKALADLLHLRPGDEVTWVPAGDSLRLVPSARPRDLSVAERLKLFDAASRRQRERPGRKAAQARGWTREELYDRGRAR